MPIDYEFPRGNWKEKYYEEFDFWFGSNRSVVFYNFWVGNRGFEFMPTGCYCDVFYWVFCIWKVLCVGNKGKIMNINMQPLKDYINERHGQLSSDEILHVLDDRNYSEIDHFEKVNGVYKMWNEDGEYFQFTKREWC